MPILKKKPVSRDPGSYRTPGWV